jgi:hypothetical protein
LHGLAVLHDSDRLSVAENVHELNDEVYADSITHEYVTNRLRGA